MQKSVGHRRQFMLESNPGKGSVKITTAQHCKTVAFFINKLDKPILHLFRKMNDSGEMQSGKRNQSLKADSIFSIHIASNR